MTTTAITGETQVATRVDPLTPELIETSTWSDTQVTAVGMPIITEDIVSVGAGLGSFALADTLRLAGLSPTRFRAVGPNAQPWANYRYLADVSQIPDEERLRSDSGSVMDNVWGFPSYAVRESWSARGWRRRSAPLWQVATEPVLSEYYTPRAGQVYASVRREAARIGWRSMFQAGQVRMVRRRAGGGYFVLVTTGRGGDVPARHALRCRHVHLAVGYAGVRFLPDLQEYRARFGDHRRVVNAYEPHDHVYEDLLRRPATVVVRGSGIVALRVVQRLLEDRDRGARTNVVHLFRTYVDTPRGPRRFRSPGANGFAHQAFNYPKAAWGGQLRDRMLALDDDERAQLTQEMGGTNAPLRHDWEDLLERGRARGWYSVRIGTVAEVQPRHDGRIGTRVVDPSDAVDDIVADYIIDATGLDAGLRSHRLFDDLLDHTETRTNAAGRLAVEPSFAVTGGDSGDGRLYASGSMTLGGPFAPVDSFLGLQYAALNIADDLARLGAAPRLTSRRSLRQWWRWLRNRDPLVARREVRS